MNLDFRTMEPKQFMEIFPITMPQSSIDHRVALGPKTLSITASSCTAEYPQQRPSYETANPADLRSFGSTIKAPLGSIVHARSGDKADNLNVGFFVRNTDEYPWLQSFMTVQRLKALFEDDWTAQRRVERCEFPNILAVHL